VNPFTVRLRFHGDLEFFLRSKPADGVIECRLKEKTSIKDVIEACGVPHPEVDVVVVDGQSVGLDHTVAAEAELEIFSAANRGTLGTDKHLQASEISRFVADGHLGKLARNLRLLGFDVAYDQRADDRQLLEVMTGQSRALLTRDRRLLMHTVVQHGYCPRSQNAEEQTVEVLRRFNLLNLIAPFTRCLRCNALLEDVTKSDIIDELEPLTKIYYEQFRRCAGCSQIYWGGSHFQKLERQITNIQLRVARKDDH